MTRKILSTIIVLTMIFTLLSGAISVNRVKAATTWYVATTGNDTTGDGSQSNPYKTIGKAVSVAVNGDTINVAAGTYDEENIVITKGITLQGAGRDSTFIAPSTATNNNTITVRNPTGDVKIDGFNFVMQPKPDYGSAVSITGTTIAVDSATVTISNNKVTGSNDGYKGDFGFYGQGNNAKIVITGNIIDKTGANSICMEQQIGTTVVEGNTFYITNDVFYDPYFSMVYNGKTVSTPQIVQGNTFYLDHSGTGYSEAITFDTAVLNGWYGTTGDTGHYTNIQIKDNIIYTGGPYARGIGIFDRSYALGNGTITGVVITGNRIIGESSTDADTYGISLRGDVRNTVIQNNEISNILTGFRIMRSSDTPSGIDVHPIGSDISLNKVVSTIVPVSTECTDIANASLNYWGTTDPAAINIAGSNIDFTPIISNGTDTDPATPGFQPSLSALIVHTRGGQSGGKSRIQEGVDAVTSGGTVTVTPGEFPEQVVINKSLTLHGAGAASTTIQVPDTLTATTWTHRGTAFNTLIEVNGASAHGITVNISGFTIDGLNKSSANPRYTGIVYHNADGTISNNIITMFGSDPVAGEDGWGVFVVEGCNVTISNNTIDNWGKGGIVVDGDDDIPNTDITATVTGNIITGAGDILTSAQNGIQISRGATGTISGNGISNIGFTPTTYSAAGILVYKTDHVTVSENELNSTETGVYVQDQNTSGGTSGNVVSDNNITGSKYGVYVLRSSKTEISGNIIDGSTYFGVRVGSGSANTTITNNTIKNSAYDGIHIESSSAAITGVVITSNDILNNNTTEDTTSGGIFVGQSGSGSVDASQVQAHFNNIVGNKQYGILNMAATGAVDATYNWWGDESGPSGEGPGTGNAVSDNVDYSPWLVPNISVTKSDSPDPVAQGMPLTYTLNWTMGSTWAIWDGTAIDITTVNIPSGLTFDNVLLKDTLPPEVTYVSCTDGGTHSLGVITWNLGTYIPGTSGSITVNVNVNLDTPDGTITNNVEIIYGSLRRLDTETTTVQKGAQSVYSFYDSRSNAYVMINLSTPRWRVTIPSKGYDTGWMSFRRYTRTNNHFWGEYADTRYHFIIDFYSSGRYHIIFDDRVTRISIKIAN